MPRKRILAPAAWLIALPLLLAASARADAQSLGFTLGKTNSDVLNFVGSRLSTSYPDRHSYTGGLTYRFPITAGIALQPELLLVQRGWAEQNHPTLSLNYVELPLLLRLDAASRKSWPVLPTFTVGTSVAVATSCSLTNADSTRVEGAGCSQRIAGAFTEDYGINRIDFGAVLGIGLDVRVSSGTVIGIEGRYEYGLTDIRRDPTRNAHNSTLFILANLIPKLRR